MDLAIRRINKLAVQIPLENPWLHLRAKEYDSMTLATWMQKNIKTYKARHIFDIGIQTVFAAEASELSFLYVLFFFHSGDNMNTLISIKNGAQQTILKGGTQGLAEKIIAPFESHIRYNQAFRRINQNQDEVVAYTDDLEITAKKCILAIPPVMINGIRFFPILPQQKAQLYQLWVLR